MGEGNALKYVNGKLTIVYKKWFSMFSRCYSTEFREVEKTYIDCSVDERWWNFQVFAQWFEINFNSNMDSSWQLDKDIKRSGNKIYSPETCCIVPRVINNIFRDDVRVNKEIKGVRKKGNVYEAYCASKYEGSARTKEEANKLYIKAEKRYIKNTIEKYKGFVTEDCYNSLINTEKYLNSLT